jgi:hypothetical protein
MKRLHQVLLIGSFVPLCWLALMAVHELRYVVDTATTGGKVERVILQAAP